MAGFLRKVAGAFVELEGEGGADKSSGSLNEITRETSELLAQLEGMRDPAQPAAPRRREPPGAPAVSSRPAGSLMGMTADEVFVAAQIVDNPNSAQRMLKLIGGLTMFPPPQQAVMVRAMDAADDTWAEEAVLEDARVRQAALRRHLQAVEEERGVRQAELDQRIASTGAEGQKIVEEIDAQIAELQRKREAAVVESTNALAGLQQEKKELEEAAETARRGITHVVNALSQLITFFTGSRGGPPTR